jgi:hypothetical protein
MHTQTRGGGFWSKNRKLSRRGSVLGCMWAASGGVGLCGSVGPSIPQVPGNVGSEVAWWHGVVCAHPVTWDPFTISFSAQPSPPLLFTYYYPLKPTGGLVIPRLCLIPHSRSRRRCNGNECHYIWRSFKLQLFSINNVTLIIE